MAREKPNRLPGSPRFRTAFPVSRLNARIILRSVRNSSGSTRVHRNAMAARSQLRAYSLFTPRAPACSPDEPCRGKEREGSAGGHFLLELWILRAPTVVPCLQSTCGSRRGGGATGRGGGATGRVGGAWVRVAGLIGLGAWQKGVPNDYGLCWLFAVYKLRIPSIRPFFTRLSRTRGRGGLEPIPASMGEGGVQPGQPTRNSLFLLFFFFIYYNVQGKLSQTCCWMKQC